MTWPDNFQEGNLGDSRPAIATDRPESIDALRQIVTDRVEQGFALYPQGGCTALDYGGVPRDPGIAIDTRALCRIIDYPAADMTVTVEAGITLAVLRDLLSIQNQRLLIDVPDLDRATVGAVYATNTSGPRRFGAGRPRDQILGVGFVTSDGALVRGGGRVVKNVAGYDFPRLLTGSMGTLGIIAEVTLKVRPRPEASVLVWTSIQGAGLLGEALEKLNTSATRPIAIEILNPSAANAIGSPLGLRSDHWVLAVGFEDNIASVAWQVKTLCSELSAFESTVIEGEETEPLWAALIGFQARSFGPITLVANVRPSAVARMSALFDPDRWMVQAHAGNGIVRAHLTETPDLETIASEIQGHRTFAVLDGGNLVLPRCPTEWKSRLKVWGEPRPDWAVCDKIKHALDTRGVMNPGRFVGKI